MERLILPLPPSLNHSHINVRRGKRLMRIRSNVTKQYMVDAGWLAREWMKKTGWLQTDKKVVMRVWIFWPDRRKRDSDNALKVLQDSLSRVLWEDDRQVLPRVMDVDVSKENPRLEIELDIPKGLEDQN